MIKKRLLLLRTLLRGAKFIKVMIKGIMLHGLERWNDLNEGVTYDRVLNNFFFGKRSIFFW